MTCLNRTQSAIWLISSEKNNLMGAIVIIMIIAIVIGLIISPVFRNGVVNLVTNIVTILFGVGTIYALVLGAVAVVTLIFTILALIIGSPGFIGLTFVLSISLILLAWLPAGIITKLFGQGFIPKSLKVFITWIAFIGFLGLVTPGLFSFKVVIGAALIAFIMLGVTVKINVLDKIIYPLVILMVAVLAWQNFFPESYRSNVRYAQSWGKRVEAMKDRGSISNEAEAATTYAIVLKDVSSLYEFSPSSLVEKAVSLKAGQTIKIVDRRDEVTIYDGQGFVQIQLPRKNGSFFGGDKYWIEAEFVEVVSPREVVPERVVAKKDQRTTEDAQGSEIRTLSFGPGTYEIQILPEETLRIRTYPSKDGCGLLSMSSPAFSYQFKFDGRNWTEDGSHVQYPYMRNPTCLLYSEHGDKIKIKVL